MLCCGNLVYCLISNHLKAIKQCVFVKFSFAQDAVEAVKIIRIGATTGALPCVTTQVVVPCSGLRC